jgi:hypothetical protein
MKSSPGVSTRFGASKQRASRSIAASSNGSLAPATVASGVDCSRKSRRCASSDLEHRGGVRWTSAVLIVVMAIFGSLGIVLADAQVAYATTLQATVLPPIDGGSFSSSPDEPHHVVYGGDYSFDVQSNGAKKQVFARFRNPSAALSLKVATVSTPACASGVFSNGHEARHCHICAHDEF